VSVKALRERAWGLLAGGLFTATFFTLAMPFAVGARLFWRESGATPRVPGSRWRRRVVRAASLDEARRAF
jgi:hypothetical protein